MVSGANKKQAKKSAAKTKNTRLVKDYGNDPFFVKKAAESKSFLEKNGFPADLLVKK